MRSFLACLALVSLLSSFTCALNATEELAVRTTLSRFTLFIDDDDFDHLDQIFTQDVFADYAGTKSEGLPAFAAFLKLGLEGIVSQHALSSTVIDDLGDSLNSTAYVTAAFLGPGKNTPTSIGTAVILYAKYVDTWTRVGDAWRINERIVKHFVSPGRPSSLVFALMRNASLLGLLEIPASSRRNQSDQRCRDQCLWEMARLLAFIDKLAFGGRITTIMLNSRHSKEIENAHFLYLGDVMLPQKTKRCSNCFSKWP